MHTRSTLIAKQGRPLVIIAVLAIIVVAYYISWVVALLLLPVPVVLGYMFRDPQREVPPIPLAVVSPADGRIMSVDPVRDNYLDRDAVRIRIRMNPFGVFTTRSPIEGKVVEQWYITDRAQQRAGDPAFAQWVQTDEGDDVVVAMHPGLFHQRPACYVQSGERIGQGQRCGFISLGTCLEIFVPATAAIHVKRGQTVIGGETSLAEFAQ